MLEGSIVALVTPMKSDGAVDWIALEKLLEWHLEKGTNGIVPMGTTVSDIVNMAVLASCKVGTHPS